MRLMPGARLGPYEVIGPIGAGGMGEVYRARDTRLGREVAIKVLAVEASADPTRRKRFELEARAVAALSHPHICPIHDVGSEGGLDYLVLELLAGETVAARLRRGPMPAPEVFRRAIEMADAIATAHRRGIVHRDLKPGNVMLTKSGAVILDFGLARIVRDEPAVGVDVAQTTAATLTETGAVLGTLQYMAPEQIEGRPADACTDVFAFGAMLFEMLTARKAFEGSSAPAVMGAILRAEAPSAVALQPTLPWSVDRLVRACLAKDPADRIASMQDVKVMLGWIQEELADSRSVAAVPVSRRRAPGLLLGVGAVAIVAIGVTAFFVGRRSAPAAARGASQVYDIPLPPSLLHWEGMALSPDGRRLALVTQPGPGVTLNPRLWIRDLGSNAPWQLVSAARDDVPHYPFWSPDGRSLAFFLKGRLVRVEQPSVVPIEICKAEDGRGGAWLDDTTIVFSSSTMSGLTKVDVPSGQTSEVVPRGPGEIGLKYPSAAGKRRVVYWANLSGAGASELRLLSLDDPEHPKPIIKSDAGAVYAHGALFYLRSGLWVGQAYDLETGEFSGDPRVVAVDRPHFGNVGAPAVSAEGDLVAAAGEGLQLTQPTWMDRTGNMVGTIGDVDSWADAAISPDGARIAMARREPGAVGADIWTIDLDTGAPRRVTTAANASRPVWSQDGQRLAYRGLTGVGGNNSVYEITAAGAQAPTLLAGGVANLAPAGWLPDFAKFVFFNAAESSKNTPYPRGILIRDADGVHVNAFRVGEEPRAAVLSPDGTRIAFAEDGFGGSDLFVDFIPRRTSQPVRVWHGEALTPQWRADGRELFFESGARLFAASVSDGPVLSVGRPAPLFDVASADYAVDPKTGRFLVLVPTVTRGPSVTITTNWPR